MPNHRRNGKRPRREFVKQSVATLGAIGTLGSATPADTTGATPVAAASCNVSACSSAYRSFRASDCTYQPTNGERRLCTKSGSAGKVAAAAHPRSAHRADPRDDYRDRRYSDRRDSYYDRRDAYDDDRRGGWGLGGLFGGGDY